jgi:hypothetical protein
MKDGDPSASRDAPPVDEEGQVCDIRLHDLSVLSPEDIPILTSTLLVSNNQLSTIPPGIFTSYRHIWRIDASYNRLSSLKFLVYFHALHTLDLRDNLLELDELLDIRHIHILHLKLSSNPFERFTSKFPLIIMALLKRAWVIDGQFIPDYSRQLAKKFKNTRQFGETILAARRAQIACLPMAGASNSARTFLAGTSCKFSDPGTFMNSHGHHMRCLTKSSQIERIRYLRRECRFHPDAVDFLDSLALAMGLLSHLWFSIPISSIVRIVAPGYWSRIGTDVESLENWEVVIVLLDICEQRKSQNAGEMEIWSALGVDKYLQTGAPSLLGHISRMILCGALFHSESAKKYAKLCDMKIFTKFRNACHFPDHAFSLENLHSELLAELQTEARKVPELGDILALRHPITDIWVNSRVCQVRRGRVTARLESDILVHFPMSSLFWDGRGVWREMKCRGGPPKRTPSGMRETFLTIAETAREEERPDPVRLAVPLPPSAVRQRNVLPSDPSYMLSKSREMMNSSRFIDRTVPPESEFRGIADPKRPTRTPFRRPPPTRKPTQIVKAVTNVCAGAEAGPNRWVRRFQVKVQNMTSKRCSYVWLNEDEIPPEDVARLVELYRAHIESKLLIVPSE